MPQINIKISPEIETKISEIKKDTGLGTTALFNQLVMNEYNRYYRHRTPTINDKG
jgi:hypothetical protein